MGISPKISKHVGAKCSPKINKRVGSNKACRWENFLKKNKICCVLIREFRVLLTRPIFIFFTYERK